MIRSIRFNSAKRLSDEVLLLSRTEQVKNELVFFIKKHLPQIAEVIFPQEEII
jgi:hypothetical protein